MIQPEEAVSCCHDSTQQKVLEYKGGQSKSMIHAWYACTAVDKKKTSTFFGTEQLNFFLVVKGISMGLSFDCLKASDSYSQLKILVE